jgi:FtsP/CotA-like multicopper oxidase with cupredoxin domain
MRRLLLLLLLLAAAGGAGADAPSRAADVQRRANAIVKRLSDPLLLAASPVLRPLETNAALRPAVVSAMQQLRTFQTAAASPPPGRVGELPQPRELVSAHGRLDVHLTLALANISTPVGRVTLRAWHLDGVAYVPAPTLRVRPGDVLTLRITNALPAGGGVRCARAALASPPVGDDDAECANTFHDGNAVNIHTHGLHVSPFYDDVFVRQPPGTTRTYVVPIKREHVPGTAWWHPHHHGAGALHVASGAAGALIVDDPRSGDAAAASMPQFAEERVLIFQEWRFNGLVSLLSILNTSFAKDYATVLAQTAPGCGFDVGSHDPSGWHAQLDPSCSFIVVNNALRPTLTLRAGAWVRLRLVAATWSSSLSLALRDAGGAGCEGVLLALDGVPLAAPMPLRAAALAGGGLLLAPGQRADVALRCSGSSGNAHESPALVMMPRDAAADGIFGAWFQQYLPNDVTRAPVVLADIAVTPSPSQLRTRSGGAAAPALPLPAPPPAYLRSLLRAPVQRRHAWAFDATIACARVAGSNCVSPASHGMMGHGHILERLANQTQLVTGFTSSGLDDVASVFYVNGALYRGAGAPALRAAAGEVHEWTLSASWVSPHVVHLHAVPFQIVSYETERGGAAPVATGAFLAGAWVDSVLVPAGGRVVVRLRFVDAGATLLHCHTLLHHDVGMAAVVDVTPAAGGDDAQ